MFISWWESERRLGEMGVWTHGGSGQVAQGREPKEGATPASKRLQLGGGVVILDLGRGGLVERSKEGVQDRQEALN